MLRYLKQQHWRDKEQDKDIFNLKSMFLKTVEATEIWREKKMPNLQFFSDGKTTFISSRNTSPQKGHNFRQNNPQNDDKHYQLQKRKQWSACRCSSFSSVFMG